jgi:hypothetical protein
VEYELVGDRGAGTFVVVPFAGVEVVAEEGGFGVDFALLCVDEGPVGGVNLRGGVVFELKVFRVGGGWKVGWARILGDGDATDNPKGAGCGRERCAEST